MTMRDFLSLRQAWDAAQAARDEGSPDAADLAQAHATLSREIHERLKAERDGKPPARA